MTLYTNCEWLDPLGVRVDPEQRLGLWFLEQATE